MDSISMKKLLGQAVASSLGHEFASTYTEWIRASEATPVTGLETFPVRYFVNGVTQAYDIFFYEHKGRRFRTLQGEYPYVRLSVPDWAHVESDELRPNDALVMSVPFYADGSVPRGYRALLDRCSELGVPVMIDAAYFGTSFGTRFDYTHPAIEMLSFSLSKTFAVHSFRIGILFSKRELSYLEEIQMQARYYNRVGASVGLALMRQFPADFMPSSYRDAHRRVCAELDVIPSRCVMLANLHDDDRRFDALLEDSRFEKPALPPGVRRRICVSGYLRHSGSPLRRLARRLLGKSG
ncbi:aminotransferase class I/II-fold pyridoxal phosphate-dependent enzyme [Sandaracinus amylolyticus]|uniref:aminotransferase class I/II-fold pyridoxal phosphate-dependent enzyme n=1 Tax=Sandaracinus amylolyticus TaxID=927083 RepID=UPI001F30C96E|nr:aminotransferase class I/II-fold pyridoxal phosphate-dependent enzyme [Sandaracinus amylolyticus]